MALLGTFLCVDPVSSADQWLEFGPKDAAHIVLVSGDEEYRSEEYLPQLAAILSTHHGFRTTVLFAIDPETGDVDPDEQTNIPGLHHLAAADLMIIATRFRELPDEQMKHIVDFVDSGKPIIGLRTATHAFYYQRNPESPYAKYGWRSEDWEGGFGQQILGDTWIAHHGIHGKESTRGVVVAANRDHPVLRGVRNVWGPTDVYALANLPNDAKVLLDGEVVAGMKPHDPPVTGEKNEPMVPVAWIRDAAGPGGSRVFTTTLGAATDFSNEGLRRLLVNACFWALGREAEIGPETKVDLVGRYEPTDFGFGDARKGLKPKDFSPLG